MLCARLPMLNNNNARNEYYLTSLIDNCQKVGMIEISKRQSPRNHGRKHGGAIVPIIDYLVMVMVTVTMMYLMSMTSQMLVQPVKVRIYQYRSMPIRPRHPYHRAVICCDRDHVVFYSSCFSYNQVEQIGVQFLWREHSRL